MQLSLHMVDSIQKKKKKKEKNTLLKKERTKFSYFLHMIRHYRIEKLLSILFLKRGECLANLQLFSGWMFFPLIAFGNAYSSLASAKVHFDV